MKSVFTKFALFGLLTLPVLSGFSQEGSEKKKPFSYTQSAKYEYRKVFTKDQGVITIQIPITTDKKTTSTDSKEEKKEGISKKFTAKSIAELLMGKSKKPEAKKAEKPNVPKPKPRSGKPMIH